MNSAGHWQTAKEGRNGPPDTDLLSQGCKGNSKFPKDIDWPKWEQTTQDSWLELTKGGIRIYEAGKKRASLETRKALHHLSTIVRPANFLVRN